MSTRLHRMIERATAPLSSLKPALPAIFESDTSTGSDLKSSTARFPSWMQSRSSLNKPVSNYVDSNYAGSISIRSKQDANRTASRGQGFEFARSRSDAQFTNPELSEMATMQRTPQLMRSIEQTEGRSEIARRDSVVEGESEPISEANLRTPMPLEIYESKQRVDADTPYERTQQKTVLDSSSNEATSSSSRESTIEVNIAIGSIDIHAARQQKPVKRPTPQSRVTLDSYLQRGKREQR